MHIHIFCVFLLLLSDILIYIIVLFSDRTLKVWSFDGLAEDESRPVNLKAKAIVAAHDKDINSIAVAPNDSLVCSGSQVSNL